MTLEKSKDYNWYYTQVFSQDARGNGYTLYFVTFAENPGRARELAHMHANKIAPDGYFALPESIHLYQKNYVRDSRNLIIEGRYCGIKPKDV